MTEVRTTLDEVLAELASDQEQPSEGEPDRTFAGQQPEMVTLDEVLAELASRSEDATDDRREGE